MAAKVRYNYIFIFNPKKYQGRRIISQILL